MLLQSKKLNQPLPIQKASYVATRNWPSGNGTNLKILFRDIPHQVHNPIAVTPFVIIPRTAAGMAILALI